MRKLIVALALAAVSAAMLTLAVPGHGRGFLAFFAFIPLFHILDHGYAGPLKTAVMFGTIFYATNLSWMTIPLSRFGHAPWVLSGLAVFLFALVLSLFYYFFTLAYSKMGHNALIPPLALALSELIRGWAFTGFPWLTLAQTQYSSYNMLSFAGLAGEYGLSFIIALVNLLVYRFIDGRRYQYLFYAVLTAGLVYGYGYYMNQQTAETKKADVRIVQPGYSQDIKWERSEKYNIYSLVSGMLRESADGDFDMIILPETAYPGFIQNDPEVDILLKTVGHDVPVITGAMRYEVVDGKRRYYNSALLFNEGKGDVYNKVHLVPFGEYFPLGDMFKPIEHYFFQGGEDFTPGSEVQVFDVNGIKVAPMICYEGAYSFQLRRQLKLGAEMVVILSNDSWFGGSAGRIQHLAVDVMRAAEYNRSVVRATQSGISAVILSDGRLADIMGIGKKGFIDAQVPVVQADTPFRTLGYLWMPLLALLAVILEIRKRVEKRRRRFKN
ncbi:apolipoprotein N-acyltransferase [Limisalsivibrio acetivorans]|uniref:apolipoprotein N-acyltransferase n=1 Tax=Limisalsivibrio acetivorans TaxID=1304888 RepID=UPI0003B6D691|nr:apolipoprotein N-acyltransferase [Limisalsivibrio acetivorans]